MSEALFNPPCEITSDMKNEDIYKSAISFWNKKNNSGMEI